MKWSASNLYVVTFCGAVVISASISVPSGDQVSKALEKRSIVSSTICVDEFCSVSIGTGIGLVFIFKTKMPFFLPPDSEDI